MNNSTADRRLPLGLFPGQPTPRLYDRVEELLQTRHYSGRTEQTYCHSVKRFIFFHNVRSCCPQEALKPYVNRRGENPPSGLSVVGLSLWLMEKADCTALGVRIQ